MDDLLITFSESVKKRFEMLTVEEVLILQKTGQIALTARGLPAGGNVWDYYFTVEVGYTGRDFADRPLAGKTVFRLPGVFSGNDLVTPQAYNMVHHPLPAKDGVPPSGAVVNLYKAAKSGSLLLASADRDANDLPISIEAGKTTNVLLDLTREGSPKVSVVITDYRDEVCRWDKR